MFTSAHLRDRRRDRAILVGSLVALALVAWLSLFLWGASPYGQYLHHESIAGPLPLEISLISDSNFPSTMPRKFGCASQKGFSARLRDVPRMLATFGCCESHRSNSPPP